MPHVLTRRVFILNLKTDKIDDAKAKAAIRAQIEADKKARAEKAAKEKALREVSSPTSPARVLNLQLFTRVVNTNNPTLQVLEAQLTQLPPLLGRKALKTRAQGFKSVWHLEELLLPSQWPAIAVSRYTLFFVSVITCCAALHEVALHVESQNPAVSSQTVTFATTFPR